MERSEAPPGEDVAKRDVSPYSLSLFLRGRKSSSFGRKPVSGSTAYSNTAIEFIRSGAEFD
jgi:hypothetical protein